MRVSPILIKTTQLPAKMCSVSSYFCHKRIENSFIIHNKTTRDDCKHKLINRGRNICCNFNDRCWGTWKL